MERKIILISVVIVVLLCSAALLRAHDIFQIVGNITQLSDTRISVKKKDGKIVVIRFRGDTDVWRSKKKVPATELKIGLGVEVRGWGDSERELEALDITITPPPKSSANNSK